MYLCICMYICMCICIRTYTCIFVAYLFVGWVPEVRVELHVQAFGGYLEGLQRPLEGLLQGLWKAAGRPLESSGKPEASIWKSMLAWQTDPAQEYPKLKAQGIQLYANSQPA